MRTLLFFAGASEHRNRRIHVYSSIVPYMESIWYLLLSSLKLFISFINVYDGMNCPLPTQKHTVCNLLSESSLHTKICCFQYVCMKNLNNPHLCSKVTTANLFNYEYFCMKTYLSKFELVSF